MKRKVLFKFFVLAVIGAFVTVTSCKDYDDDISRIDTDLAAAESSLAAAVTELNTLKTQVASLPTTTAVESAVAAAKTEAIEAAKTEATSLLNALKGGYTGTLKDINDDITDLAGLITVLQGDVSQLGSDLDDALLEIAANKAAIALQQGILDKYLLEPGTDNVVDAINAIKVELESLATTASIENIQDQLDELSDKIDAIDAALNVLNFASINSMITGISFDYENDDIWARWRYLDFSTAPARKTWTFGQGFEGAIAFKTGDRILDAEQTIEVKVSPATADLKKLVDAGKVYLIRRDGDNKVNNFVKAVDAERSTALRAAPTVTGLWNLTFQMPAEANVAGLTPLVADANGSFYFAVAIENTVDQAEDAEERFVISDFSVQIDASNKVPVYNDQDAPDNDLIFSVKKGTEAVSAYKPHTAIKNRYLLSENQITAPADKKWATGVWNTTETKADDTDDNRTAQNFFGVETGKTFNVKLDNPTDVFAYYIVLDREWAVESSPSELNAWNSYDIDGLDQVYKATETASLQINTAAANGDIIGFRVVAVNYDGTLVDPDGKSFYVYVGDVASSGLNFTQTIDAPVATATTTVPSNILPFSPGVDLANAASATFSMTIGHSVVLDMTNIVRLDADDNPVSTWTATKKLQIVNVKPSDLQEGVTYNGTLTLNNNFNVPFSTTSVTLTKVLPTFDGTGIGYKTNIHHDGNVIYAYPLPATQTYNLANALNGIGSDGAGYQVVNSSTFPSASLPTWSATNTEATVPVAEIGVPYLPAAAPGHGKIYDLRLSKDFGYVLYNGSANHLVYWAPSTPIKVEFRSYVQDLKEWQYKGSNQANTPALKYADDLATYDISNITALPPVGSRVDLTNTPALQDGRDFTVTDVKVLTGAPAYDKVNEYFVPTLTGTNISFDAVITSPPSAPVATKLQVTLEDNFGHEYTFVIPKEFNMAIN